MEYNGIQIGNRLYNARIKKGLKQSEVSEALGITQPAYSRYELGERDVTLKMLFQLSLIFDVNISYFSGEDTVLSDSELIELERYRDYLIHKRK